MVREFLPETTYPSLEGFCESGLTHLLGELLRVDTCKPYFKQLKTKDDWMKRIIRAIQERVNQVGTRKTLTW